jgi:hypothetical protein
MKLYYPNELNRLKVQFKREDFCRIAQVAFIEYKMKLIIPED